MVASPETNRLNGRKSRGPVTIRGKAISSKNATKHGALAKSPPLLITEDLESFQGIVQGLVDEYQPESATEQLLIQQVAMGWLRLHRLWGAEAASANIEILKVQSAAKFPNPKFEALLGEREALVGLVKRSEQNDVLCDLELVQDVQKVRLRIQEIDKTLADIETYTKAIQKAQATSQGIQNPELFTRYEKTITTSLYDALDRLQARSQQDSIGSFGR